MTTPPCRRVGFGYRRPSRYDRGENDLRGNVPGTTDGGAGAGCSGYDPGSGTYTYESYE